MLENKRGKMFKLMLQAKAKEINISESMKYIVLNYHKNVLYRSTLILYKLTDY